MVFTRLLSIYSSSSLYFRKDLFGLFNPISHFYTFAAPHLIASHLICDLSTLNPDLYMSPKRSHMSDLFLISPTRTILTIVLYKALNGRLAKDCMMH